MKSSCQLDQGSDFECKVDEWGTSSWEDGSRTFGELLSSLPGVYPSEALACTRRLNQEGVIDRQQLRLIEEEAITLPILDSEMKPSRRIMLDHPVDFEWRFTRTAVSRVLEELRRRLAYPRRPTILCLGCPSVYLAGRDMSDLTFHLCDKNGRIIGQIEEALELQSHDLSQAILSNITADAAVIDPPWYLPFYRLFIWAACHRIPIGGYILLSFPPEGTRASAASEFTTLKKWCEAIGLRFETRNRNYLPYRSPLFEVNALREEGILNFPLNWRRGDLVIFRKEFQFEIERPEFPKFPYEWQEIHVGPQRVKVLTTMPTAPVLLEAVGPSEVLPSVSSRHILRAAANVVTSGNRFLKTSTPDLLIECFQKIADVRSSNDMSLFAQSALSPLCRKALELACKEDSEANCYFQRTHEL
jgi:hypothetical protein